MLRVLVVRLPQYLLQLVNHRIFAALRGIDGEPGEIVAQHELGIDGVHARPPVLWIAAFPREALLIPGPRVWHCDAR